MSEINDDYRVEELTPEEVQDLEAEKAVLPSCQSPVDADEQPWGFGDTEGAEQAEDGR